MELREIELCGQRIFSQNAAECLAWLRSRADHGEVTMIATPNPEMLLRSMSDREFSDVLAKFDLRIPDGFGLRLVSFVLGKHICQRITGSDLILPLAGIASEYGWAFVMIGDDTLKSNQVAASVILAKYPSLNIISLGDVMIGRDFNGWTMPDKVSEALSLAGPSIVMVGLGMQKQEGWIQQHLHGFPDVKMAIGCGGAFAMVGGTLPRAPKWMQSLGIEWLWRLRLEPKRIGRIMSAVFVFPVRAIIYEIFSKR